MSYFRLLIVMAIGGIASGVLNYLTGSMLAILVAIPIGLIGGNWISRDVR